MGDSNIRGTHMLNVVAYVKTKKGIKGVQELLDNVNSLKPTKQYAFDNLHEGAWYPFTDYMIFMREADKMIGGGDLSCCREIGRRLVKNMGTFSHIISTESIEKWLRTAEVRFHYIYSEGRMEITTLEEKRAILEYHGFPAKDEVFLYFMGSLEGGMKMMGLDGEVKQKTRPDKDGEPIVFELTWA